MVNDCSTRLNERNQQSAEPIISHKIPEIQWTKIGTDVFELHKKTFWLYHQVVWHSLSCRQSPYILKACLQNLAFHSLSSMIMVLNSKQMNSKYLQRIEISNRRYLMLSMHNPMVLWNALFKPSNAPWRNHKKQSRLMDRDSYSKNNSIYWCTITSNTTYG